MSDNWNDSWKEGSAGPCELPKQVVIRGANAISDWGATVVG